MTLPEIDITDDLKADLAAEAEHRLVDRKPVVLRRHWHGWARSVRGYLRALSISAGVSTPMTIDFDVVVEKQWTRRHRSARPR